MEKYLNVNMNVKHRKNLTRLRISAHELHIELGRRYNLPPDKRICKVCNNGVEDEHHFLFLCRALNNIRTSYLDKLQIEKNEEGLYDKERSLKKLFDNNKNPNFYRIVGEFCFKMNELREKILLAKKSPSADIIIKTNLSRYDLY